MNTGGEKVFVEEVEDVLKRHADVVDVLVVGRPSERFGQEVTAIVELGPSDVPNPASSAAWCTARLARYKAPRAFVFVAGVERHPSGKADYRWARVTSERPPKPSEPGDRASGDPHRHRRVTAHGAGVHPLEPSSSTSQVGKRCSVSASATRSPSRASAAPMQKCAP